MITYVTIDKAKAKIERYFDNNASIREENVDAALREQGIMVHPRDMYRLITLLRNVPLTLTSDQLAQVKNALGGQPSSIDNIRRVSQSAGLGLSHRQILGAVHQFRENEGRRKPKKRPPSAEVTQSLVEKVAAHLGDIVPTEASVATATKELGIRLKTRDIRLIARHLNQRSLEADTPLDEGTIRIVRLLTQKTRLLPQEVIRLCIYQSIKHMTLNGSPRFDVDVSDPIGAQVLEIQLTALPPAPAPVGPIVG